MGLQEVMIYVVMQMFLFTVWGWVFVKDFWLAVWDIGHGLLYLKGFSLNLKQTEPSSGLELN